MRIIRKQNGYEKKHTHTHTHRHGIMECQRCLVVHRIYDILPTCYYMMHHLRYILGVKSLNSEYKSLYNAPHSLYIAACSLYDDKVSLYDDSILLYYVSF